MGETVSVDVRGCLAAAVGRGHRPDRGLAPARRREPLHRLLGPLHPSGLPGALGADAGLFLCPCHGGVYYADGTVSAGPPPRALPQYPVRVNNGQVEIQTSPIPIA